MFKYFFIFSLIFNSLYAQIISNEDLINSLSNNSNNSSMSTEQVLNLMEAKKQASNTVYDKTVSNDLNTSNNKTVTQAKKDNNYNFLNYEDNFDSLYMLSIYKRFYEKDSLMKKVKIFGEQYFFFSTDMFKPIDNMPIPVDYRFGAGDIIELSFWGDIQTQYTSQVRKDGNVILPHIGRIFVSGLSYNSLKQKLLKRYSKVFSTLAYGKKGARTFMDLNLSKMRSINVYVLGEAQNPGVYSLNGLSNVYAGIYFSGGPSKNGSFRDIQLIRNNKVIAKIDLYDFLINGKMPKKMRLQDGDIILYNRYIKHVTINGAVIRPLTYELKKDETLKDLMKFCGGVKNSAYIKNVTVSRLLPFERRTTDKTREESILEFNTIEELNNSNFLFQDDDYLAFKSIINENINKIFVGGNGVNHGGYFGINNNIKTVKNAIDIAGGLKKNAFNKITLFRRLKTKQFSATTLILPKDANKLLKPYDSIITYTENELKDIGKIKVVGLVNNPGVFDYNPGMKLSDILLLAKGFKYNADTNYIEINRVDTLDDKIFSNVFKIKMDKQFNIINGENLVLKPRDAISIHGNPNIIEKKEIKIMGYVKYPGTYYLKDNNERLSELLERAGGVRADGNLKAATLQRNKIKVNIDICNAYKHPKSSDNIKLIAGDSIYVPTLDQTVRVYGEVLFPSRVVWKPGKAPSYYINEVGGLKEDADKDRIAAFYANGKRAKIRTCWFDDKLEPGSYIYIPKMKKKKSYFFEGLKITRESIGVLSSVAALVVSYYTIKELKK